MSSIVFTSLKKKRIQYNVIDLFKKVMTSELATNLLPSILVPLVGIMIPAVSIVMLGRYITATE